VTASVGDGWHLEEGVTRSLHAAPDNLNNKNTVLNARSATLYSTRFLRGAQNRQNQDAWAERTD